MKRLKDLLSYINGKEDAKTSAPAGIEHRGGNLTLGCYNGDRPLKGILDEVKIWNEPLSAKDIEVDMKGLKAVSPNQKIPSLWGFIKGSK